VILVMVVDDEALVRSGFSLILGAVADIEVVATATGADAVAAVREHRPDVLLLRCSASTARRVGCPASTAQ
jgi:DNA-binding NarL/FixJ family response regulator